MEQARQYALKAEVPATHPTEFPLGIIGPPPASENYDFLVKPFPGEVGFSITKAAASSDSITVSGISPEETGFRLAFQYAAESPREVKETISIVTNDPIQPLRIVEVTGRVIDFVELEENVAYLGRASPNEPRNAKVKLLSPAWEQKDQLAIQDSNFQHLASRGLDVKLEGTEVLTLLVATTPRVDVGRSKGVLQREVARFSWSLGPHRGETQLEILFIVI